MNRNKKIIQTSILGIVANVFLAAFKAFVGLAANSIAIVMDAVNNLSDAMSSLITIIGTKLAAKDPDKKHPFGYGRIEYLSATVISAIVLYAGITALVESVKKIIHPDVPDYSTVALIIVGAAVAVKILLGLYVKKTGQAVNSDALVASGKDALFDSILSASTLLAAIIYITIGVSLEAWLGAIISLFIIKAGFDMLCETISEILGERVGAETASKIHQVCNSFPEILGSYDLVVHNYGPKQIVGSIHIEVDEHMTARQLDVLQRELTNRIYAETDVAMTGISVYSMNTDNAKAVEMRNEVEAIALADPDILQVHGFYLDEEQKLIRFDIVIDFDAKDKQLTRQKLCDAIKEKYPDYEVMILLDYDIADLQDAEA